MRKVIVTRVVPFKINQAWDYLSDIKSYPRYVTFVKKVEVREEPKKGSQWYDITSILWIPFRLKHTNTQWKKHNKIAFTVKLPLRGYMSQQYSLSPIGDKTQITCIIYFDLANKIVDAVLGSFLSKRLEYMLVSSLINLEKKFYQGNVNS